MTRPPVVVAGGGLAGAAFAACLAVRGTPVTVLERTAVPGAGEAEALAPGVHALLSGLGLSGRVHEAGFARGEVSVLGSGNGEEPWRSAFAETGGIDHGYHVCLGALVELLLQRAGECGARVVRGAEVIEPLTDGGRVTGVVVHTAGQTETLPARLVADATGTARVVAGRFCAAEPDPLSHRVFRAVAPADATTEQGAFVLEGAPGEWHWRIPLAGGVVGLGRLVPGGGGDAGGDDGERWRGYRCARLAGAGWLSVGDAAGLADPAFLDPATVALLAAQAAASAVPVLCGDESEEAARGYMDCYAPVVECARAFAAFCLDPARHGENTETLLRGFTAFAAGEHGGALARIRAALAGHRPLFDVEYPLGPLVASLAMPER
ncbi:NAD(P)/FAD-dependent oxidoreductase [Prauserella flavalba]|uniref:NAD(P)/FAD-dependent oxidoreductase n=1 Tax=Prauserella flavalba TaxID=1477506 RepID=UPI0036E07AFF